MSANTPSTDIETTDTRTHATPLAGPMSRRSLLGGALAAGLGVALVPRLVDAAPGEDEGCEPKAFALKKRIQESKKKQKESSQKGGYSQDMEQKEKGAQEEYTKQGYTGAAAKPGAYERHAKRAHRRRGQERAQKSWRKSADGASNVPLWLDLDEKTTLEGLISVDSIATPEACGDLAAISFEASFKVSEGSYSAKELAATFAKLQLDEASGEGPSFYVQFGDSAEFSFLAELAGFEYSYAEPQFLGSKGSFGFFAVVLSLNTSKKEA